MQGESAEEPIPVVSPREERTLRTANSVQDFRHRIGNHQAMSGPSNNAPSQHSPSPVRPANPPTALSERSLSQPQLTSSIKSLPQIPPRDSKRLTDSAQSPAPAPNPAPTTGNALTNSASNLSTQQQGQPGKDEPSLGLQKRTSDQTLHRKISIGTHVHPQSAQQQGEKERQSGERPSQPNAQGQGVNQGSQQGNVVPSGGLSGAPNTGGNPNAPQGTST